MGQDQIVAPARHQDHPRTNRFTGNPNPGPHLASIGLPDIILLRQPVFEPFLDEAEWPLGLRSFFALLGWLDVFPQPGNGPWRSLPPCQEAGDVVQSRLLVAAAIGTRWFGRRELLAPHIRRDPLV